MSHAMTKKNIHENRSKNGTSPRGFVISSVGTTKSCGASMRIFKEEEMDNSNAEETEIIYTNIPFYM